MPKCIQPFVAFCARKYVLASIFCGHNANLSFFVDKRGYGVSWFRNEFMRFGITVAIVFWAQ